jgi:hypothetical protein
MASIATYTPEQVYVVIAGILNADGFAEGTFINVSKDDAPYRSRTTADGVTVRLYRNSQTYTVELTFHIGSTSNDFLTKLWQLDEITQRGKFPLLIKDGSGSDLFFSATSWIEGLPTMVKSTNFDTRTWRIKCSSAGVNFGSNSDESSLVEDLINIASSALPAIEGIL